MNQGENTGLVSVSRSSCLLMGDFASGFSEKYQILI